MAAHAKQSCSDIIYHIGSSSRNPICISNIANFLFQYFTQNPLTDKKGKLVKVAKDLFLTENMTTLHLYISIRFMLPLKKSLIAVSGEISCEDLSVKDVQLREKLWKEIDIIVDSAATTSFDARYEFAFGTNTLGALHVLSFAKKCINIKMLVHISTVKAATSKLDFKAEEKTVAEKLNELLAQGASEDEFTLLMKDFGIKRSKLHGWPNTYAFTKAMGEICLRQSKEMLPLIIVRPTMVTGSYKEPSPGWIEGLRTVDAAIASYAKGKIKCFLGNPKLIVDLIPGNMVIKSIMVAMAVNANQSSEIIYHVGSSLRNPIYLSNIVNFMFQYFAKNPLIDKKGKLVKTLVKLGKPVVLFTAMATLKTYMANRFMLRFV
nr:fatty acyl-CoA reductase 8-like [Ziziphus jujuba var. spinosa]